MDYVNTCTVSSNGRKHKAQQKQTEARGFQFPCARACMILVKAKQAKVLAERNMVKVVLMFRGREAAANWSR